MANTLTSLAPVIYAAARITPREMVGVLGAIRRDFDDKGMAKGDTLKVPVSPAMSVASVTASQTFTAGSDRVASSKSITLGNFKEVSWNLTAEEERSLENSQSAQEIFRQTVEQGIRAIVNDVESVAWLACYKGSSRATGTAGTTPFATTLGDLTAARRILVDNGISVNAAECSVVIDSAAGVKLRDLTPLQKVSEAGSSDHLRQGVLGDLFGFAVRESNAIGVHTKGTGASYLINMAAHLLVGGTAVTVDTGTGTVLAGDIVTFAGTTAHKYVVNAALASNAFSIGEPGARIQETDNDAITVGADYTANLALHRNAAIAIVRPALQPAGGGVEQMTVTDPVTGLSFLMLRVVGNAMTSYYMRAVYDVSVVNPFGIATILG
ncbi:P22 phage major capsid protein family protein [Methylibium sp.]|uniref:P22 phage major capsid protein family protein n=1 Tax=Methylibium sp. TaxID=2067992 RepID=UPI0017B12376|nr:P22 phage major capsid protein family protein [Methylibium sp.]MBA3589675.1 hypothetical protein [Methylibium sp.]